jgi:Tfp pilus assembly protein PilO
MNSWFDKLNLRPQERRLLVAVGVVVFIVLNIWLVWPRFNDWKIVTADHEKAKRTLANYQREIGKTSSYETKLKALEGDGASVVAEEQELDSLMARTVQNQTLRSGVTVNQSDPSRPSNTRTNQFFEERTVGMRFEAGNEELVNFLMSMASTNSLIRVQDLNLQPAPNQMKLNGNITLVGSYQKKPPAKSSATLAGTNVVAAAKPAPAGTNKAATATTSTNKAATAKSKTAVKTAPKP